MRKHGGADAEATVMLNVRVPTSLWMAIEQRVDEERRARPGEHIQRSDIVRMALAKVLLASRSEPANADEKPAGSAHAPREASDWNTPLPHRPPWHMPATPGRTASLPARQAALGQFEGEAPEADLPVDAPDALTVENLRVVVTTPGEPTPAGGRVLSDRASAILNLMFKLVLNDPDDQQAVFDFLDTLSNVLRGILRTFDGEGGLRQHGPNRLTTLGNLVSFWSRRAILQRALDRHRWSLNTTAEVLGISGGTSTILRLISDLDLEPQLEQARVTGLVKQGRKNKPVT